MNRIQYRQLTTTKKMIFIFLYMALLLNGLFYFFGFVEVINYIQSFSGSSGKIKILSFLSVVVALFPILALVKYTGDKYTVAINTISLMLFKKDNLFFSLHLKDIYKMQIKQLSVMPLIFYGVDNSILLEIQPYELKKDKSSVVFQITDIIQQHRDFEEKEITQKQFGYPHKTHEFIGQAVDIETKNTAK